SRVHRPGGALPRVGVLLDAHGRGAGGADARRRIHGRHEAPPAAGRRLGRGAVLGAVPQSLLPRCRACPGCVPPLYHTCSTEVPRSVCPVSLSRPPFLSRLSLSSTYVVGGGQRKEREIGQRAWSGPLSMCLLTP